MTACSRDWGHEVRGRNPDASREDPAVICLRLHTSVRSPESFLTGLMRDGG